MIAGNVQQTGTSMTSVPIQSSKNIFFFCVPAWGHSKPVIALASRILESRPNVVITFFTFGSIYPKILAEIDKIPHGKGPGMREDVQNRLFVIDVCGMIVFPLVPVPAFTPAFEALWNGEPIKCLSSGKEYTSLPRPSVAIMDPFAGYAIEAIRDTTLPHPGGPLRMLAWLTAPSGPCLRILGPATMGGIGLSGRLSMKTIRYGTEEDIMPIMGSFNPQLTGKVISIPGTPTMYDYEFLPQESLSASILEELGRIYVPQLDGAFFTTASSYEKDALVTVNKWLGEGNVYPVGPLSMATREEGASSGDLLEVGDGDKATKMKAVEFLDQMQAKFGEKSVVYMSFGSLFWPSDEDKMWAAIEAFLANDVPIIFAHPSPFKKPINEEKLRMLQESPIATDFEWAPQETILMHPATGWFVSHGGWNSTQEAFVYRVPQIFWPFAADQPYNSALMSQVHKAAFELINVRTGPGAQLPYRFKDLPESEQPKFTVDAVREEICDLLIRLKGDEGLLVRKNFEQLAKTYLNGWEQYGEARGNMERFLKKYVD
ncbi:hypothetical protein VKT23_018295 [Stygiomarasmius scandens]|uniref:UDP-Glycosyltransferase/glycogen phosphorylase n=1 Tax=Marasmiellus scandens TaxID=2682957 RepID=A0ABR1IPJ6_9AGAR